MCEYCKDEKVLLNRMFPSNCIYLDARPPIDEDNYIVIIDRKHLRLCMDDDHNCLDHGERIEINYCPFCGEKL